MQKKFNPHVCMPICIIHIFVPRLLCTNSSNYTHTKWSVAVSPADNVVVSPELEIANVGGTIKFTCSTQGSPNNTYQWQKDGDLIEETSATLTISNITAVNGGNYTCVVSNAAGTGSAAAILYVEPIIITQPNDIHTTNGTVVNFTCEAESFPDPVYQWEKYSETTPTLQRISSGPVLQFTPAVYEDCVASLPGTDRNVTSKKVVLAGK